MSTIQELQLRLEQATAQFIDAQVTEKTLASISEVIERELRAFYRGQLPELTFTVEHGEKSGEVVVLFKRPEARDLLFGIPVQ